MNPDEGARADAGQAWDHSVVDVGRDGPLALDTWSVGPADADATVIALHGFPQSARCFREVGTRLAARGLRVVAPDQRGYSPGARPEDVADYRVEILAQDILTLADQLGLESFHLVGHDWGAQVGWVLCRDAAERVRTFTALSVPHPRAYAIAYRDDEEQHAAAAYIRTFWKPEVGEASMLADGARGLRRVFTGIPQDEIEHYVVRMSQPGAMTAALAWYRAMESTTDFPPTRVPTTYVWGSRDPALRRSGAELCGQHVEADYRFVELDEGHWLPDLAAPEVTEAILDRVAPR